MAAKKRGNGAVRTIIRLSLPVICTVTLSGAGLSSALAFEAPLDAGGQYGSSVNNGGGNGDSGNKNDSSSGTMSLDGGSTSSMGGAGGSAGMSVGGGSTGMSTGGDGGGTDAAGGGSTATSTGTSTATGTATGTSTGTGTSTATSTSTGTGTSTATSTGSAAGMSGAGVTDVGSGNGTGEGGSTGTSGTNGSVSDDGKSGAGGSTGAGGTTDTNAGQNNGYESNGDVSGGDAGVDDRKDVEGRPKLGLVGPRMMMSAPAAGGVQNDGNNAFGNEGVNGKDGVDKKVALGAGESGSNDGENNGVGDTGGVDNQTGQASNVDGENGRGTGEGVVPQMRLMLSAPSASNGRTVDETNQPQSVSYDYNAGLYSEVAPDDKPYAGVYETKVNPNAESGNEIDGSEGGKIQEAATQQTIGMPSIADANLPNIPTTESPAIIVGAAVGYEEKTGAVEYKKNKERDTPYSEFTWSIVDEQKATDATSHKKLTGYDGTYVIVRLDVSDFFRKTGQDGSFVKDEGGKFVYDDELYLHVKQEGNNTLLAATGMVSVTNGLEVQGPMLYDEKTKTSTALTEGNTFTGIPNANASNSGSGTGNQQQSELTWKDASATSTTVVRTGSYTYRDLLDATSAKAYLDILVFATASNVAGADVGKTGALNGDIPISMYVDKIDDYTIERDKSGNPIKDEAGKVKKLVYDPTSQDVRHIANCLGKFYDAERAAEEAAKKAASTVIKISKYLVKGSDLALETMVKNSDKTGEETTYWSLSKSFEKPYYDQEIDRSANDRGSGRTVSLMSEVAVTKDLKLEGTDANDLRKRTLDVNSFDVQVAHNTGEQKDKAKVNFGLTNAWLTIADYSNTTGAELAVGNNSQFVIDQGGRLIVDETCQLEVEWDGATAQANTNTGNGTGNNGGTNTQQQTDILNNGFLDLRRGGTVVNNGIITIEGTEGKPYQPEQKKQATTGEKGYGEFMVREGATLINNGAMMVYGKLYNLGTIENNGAFNDTIVSNDPDRGQFSYHKGIQVSWKDDVTQPGVVSGELVNGMDKAKNTVPTATIVNRGDIVLVPGTLTNHGVIDNRRYAHILACPVEDLIIPVEPAQPTDPAYKRKKVSEAFKENDPNSTKEFEDSYINNFGTIVNRGVIATATVELNDDTSFGAMTIGAHPERFNFNNDTVATLTNYGYIPGYPTEIEPIPAPEPTPEPAPYDPRSLDNGSWDLPRGQDDGSGTSVSPTSPGNPGKPSQGVTDALPVIHRAGTQPTVGQILTNGALTATVTQTGNGDAASGTVHVVADPVVTEIAEGAYEVVSMPEIDVAALVAGDPDHTVDDIAKVWWCVYIDGVLVRIMDTSGHLAPGIARIVWADSEDLTQATLMSDDFVDGAVVYLTPDTELFLEVLWS